MTTAGGAVLEAAAPKGRDALVSQLFTLHYARLAGWSRRLVDDDETAHDLAAEVFARVLGRLGAVDDPRAYLYAAAANLVRDHWRSLERQRRAYATTAASQITVSAAPDTEVRQLRACARLSTVPLTEV